MKIRTNSDMIVNHRLRQVGHSFRIKERWRAVFECECGDRVVMECSDVKHGKTKSCGCFAREATILRSSTHGQAATSRQSRTYRSWSCMKRRCTVPHDEHWSCYGGRGIVICDRWLNSFEAFFEDMGERPPMATLDRIDCNGNYEPSNCRWATNIEQQRNRRNNRLLTAFGKTMCVTDWANETGIWKTTIKERLNRGWTAEQALTKPVKKQGVSGSQT